MRKAMAHFEVPAIQACLLPLNEGVVCVAFSECAC